MPFSNQPTFDTALQVAMQAGQRRDNLAGLQAQSHQAGIAMSQNLLQMALQERAMDETTRQFDSRRAQVDDHFGQQMSLARDQQTINKIAGQRADMLGILDLQERASGRVLETEMQALSQNLELLFADQHQGAWQDMLGLDFQDRGFEMLSYLTDSTIARGTAGMQRFEDLGIDTHTGLLTGLLEQAGLPVERGQESAPVQRGRTMGGTYAPARQSQPAQDQSRSSMQSPRAPSPTMSPEGGMIRSMMQESSQHRNQERIQRQENWDTETLRHLGFEDEALHDPTLRGILAQDGVSSVMNPQPLNFAAGPRTYGGWLGKARAAVEYVSHPDHTTARERVLSSYRHASQTGDITHMGTDALDFKDYWQVMERSLSPHAFRKMGRYVVGGENENYLRRRQDLQDSRGHAQARYAAVFHENYDPEMDNASEAHKVAMREAHHPAIQLGALANPRLGEIARKYRSGQGMSTQDRMSIEETLEHSGLGNSIEHFLSSMRSALDKDRLYFYDIDQENAFKNNLEYMESMLFNKDK